MSQPYIFKCINVQPAAAPDEVARVSEMSSMAFVSQSLWRSHPQYERESWSQCFRLLKSGKMHSQTKPLRVWLYKYWCRNIADLFSLLAGGLFNFQNVSWEKTRFRWVLFCRCLLKKKTKQTPKECRIGLKQTVCAVPPFMPSPGQFISSNVGAAGQKSLFSVGLAMLSVHIVDPSAACTQHIQWKIKSSAPHCTRL